MNSLYTKPIRRRYGWQVTAVVTTSAYPTVVLGWSDISPKKATRDLERKLNSMYANRRR